jgi:hypothetical protein
MSSNTLVWAIACVVCSVDVVRAAQTVEARQSAPLQIDALVAAVRPALPFPAATSDGDFPADNSPQSKWFVIWPTSPEETRITVKANPLNPETQKAAAAAMGRIQDAVITAERKAQAAYDRALDELRRTGKVTDIDGISLDDEGIDGERIDAELELVIEIQEPQSFTVRSGVPPKIVPGNAGGAMWTVSIPGNVYRAVQGNDLREHFRAAETVLYFGSMSRPEIVPKGNDSTFTVSVPSGSQAVTVVLRGNETLLNQVLTSANWSVFAAR